MIEIRNKGNNELGHILKKVGTFFEFMPVAILPFPWSFLRV